MNDSTAIAVLLSVIAMSIASCVAVTNSKHAGVQVECYKAQQAAIAASAPYLHLMECK